MKNLAPDGKGGACLIDIPRPELFENAALCRATHGLISTGTERMIIRNSVGKSLQEIAEKRILLGYTGAGVVEETRGDGIAVKPVSASPTTALPM